MSLAVSQENMALDVATVTTFVAGVNTEFKCSIMEALMSRFGLPMTERQVFEASLLPSADPLPNRKLQSNNVATAIMKFPAGLVEIGQSPTSKERDYTLTQAGMLSAAIGGHLMRLSAVSNKPIRQITGEYTGNAGVLSYVGSLEARLIALSGLMTHALHQWKPSTFLYREFAKFGLSKQAAAAHLSRIHEAGLSDTTKIANDEGKIERIHRIRPGNLNKHHSVESRPANIIHEYLSVIGQFAMMDVDFLNEGIYLLKSICQDDKTMSFMITRSFVSTAHTKQTRKAIPVRPDGVRMPKVYPPLKIVV
jgi:hypothetical protein